MFFGFDLKELRAAKGKALMGFVSMNVVNPPAGTVWGKFNNRKVDANWVSQMTERFASHLDSCAEENSMDVALDPDWLFSKDPLISVIDGNAMEEVPALKFTKQGEVEIKNNNLWMLSGNHRRLALCQHVAKMKAVVESAKETIKGFTEGKSDEDMAKLDDVSREKMTQAEQVVNTTEPKILKSSMWTVRVFNRGAWYHTPRGDGRPTYRTSSPDRDRTRRRAGQDKRDLQADIEELGEGSA